MSDFLPPTLADDGETSNPKKTPTLRVVQESYDGAFITDDADFACGARVFFLPEDLSWGGALSQAILSHTGAQLDDYILENVIAPKRGSAFLIPSEVGGGNLYILGIIPKWDGGLDNEERALKACIRSVLEMAEQKGIESLAFPALGMGRKDYPVRKAARLMMSVLRNFPYHNLVEVRVVWKNASIFGVYRS